MLTIGTPGKMDGADSQTTLNRPTAIAYDSAANEVFIADSGNRRIAVFDADNGTYKRHWFAYGEKAAGAAPGPYDPNAGPAKSFRDVTCVEIARDGMVYVCDKSSNRIQVFDKTGKFVKEGFIAKNTLGGIVDRQLRRAAERGGRGVGRRVLERPAAALPLRRRRPEQESARREPRHARRRSARSAAAAGTRVSSWRLRRSRPTRRATYTRASCTTASACRSSRQGSNDSPRRARARLRGSGAGRRGPASD